MCVARGHPPRHLSTSSAGVRPVPAGGGATVAPLARPRWRAPAADARSPGYRHSPRPPAADAGARIGLRQPRQHRRTAAGPQALLGGPERFAPAHVEPVAVVEFDTGAPPGRRIGQRRRRHQHHRPLLAGQTCQQRPQQRELPAAGTATEQLTDRPARPAARRQCRIQRLVAAGDRAGGCLGGALLGTPDDAAIEQPIERAHRPRLRQWQRQAHRTRQLAATWRQS